MKKLLVKYAWFLAALVLFLGYVMLFRTAEVSGTSMTPTYSHQDMLLLLRSDAPNPGNIVAIYSYDLKELLCKRVIGVAGDHVVITSDGLCVNDVWYTEDYVSTSDWYETSDPVDVVVPDNEIFVLGDNRVASIDSRRLGCLPTDNILGVVVCNVTKSFGIKRETLVRAVTLLIIGSIAYEVFRKLKGFGNGAAE